MAVRPDVPRMDPGLLEITCARDLRGLAALQGVIAEQHGVDAPGDVRLLQHALDNASPRLANLALTAAELNGALVGLVELGETRQQNVSSLYRFRVMALSEGQPASLVEQLVAYAITELRRIADRSPALGSSWTLGSWCFDREARVARALLAADFGPHRRMLAMRRTLAWRVGDRTQHSPLVQAVQGVVLRPILAADRPAIALAYGRQEGCAADQLAAFMDLPDWSWQHSLVAEDSRGVVAAALVRLQPQGPYLEWLFVRDDSRRQGLARVMLQRLHALLARTGARAVQLDVNETNIAARRLYVSLGYESQPTRNWTSYRASHTDPPRERRSELGRPQAR